MSYPFILCDVPLLITSGHEFQTVTKCITSFKRNFETLRLGPFCTFENKYIDTYIIVNSWLCQTPVKVDDAWEESEFRYIGA